MPTFHILATAFSTMFRHLFWCTSTNTGFVLCVFVTTDATTNTTTNYSYSFIILRSRKRDVISAVFDPSFVLEHPARLHDIEMILVDSLKLFSDRLRKQNSRKLLKE